MRSLRRQRRRGSQRYDFPHEKFFSDKVDESVLDWKPSGAEPKLADASVQSRIDSTLGEKAIVVPPALEEKMTRLWHSR